MYKSSDLYFLDFIYIFTSLRAVAEQYGGGDVLVVLQVAAYTKIEPGECESSG